jgi:hypothetical protein
MMGINQFTDVYISIGDPNELGVIWFVTWSYLFDGKIVRVLTFKEWISVLM